MLMELRLVLNVFRPTSRVNTSRPIDYDFRRFVPDFSDGTALFLVDLTSRKGHEIASRFKETRRTQDAALSPSKSSSSSPVLEFSA